MGAATARAGRNPKPGNVAEELSRCRGRDGNKPKRGCPAANLSRGCGYGRDEKRSKVR